MVTSSPRLIELRPPSNIIQRSPTILSTIDRQMSESKSGPYRAVTTLISTTPGNVD